MKSRELLFTVAACCLLAACGSQPRSATTTPSATVAPLAIVATASATPQPVAATVTPATGPSATTPAAGPLAGTPFAASVSGTPAASLAASPAAVTPAAAAPVGPPVHVEIQLFEFTPKVTEVHAGTTVTWTNHDAIIHSVTNGVSPMPAGAFNSGFFDVNQAYSFTFNQPGDYPYFCMRHPFMQGEIRVLPAS